MEPESFFYVITHPSDALLKVCGVAIILGIVLFLFFRARRK